MHFKYMQYIVCQLVSIKLLKIVMQLNYNKRQSKKCAKMEQTLYQEREQKNEAAKKRLSPFHWVI